MLPLTRVAGRVATATDFAAAMQHMIREVVPEREQYRMRIMVDEAAGHVLQSQGENCIVFASQGPHLLQIGLSNLPSSFKPAPGSLAPQAANLDECRSWSTCGSCTGSLGCGWCSADNKCKTGGSSGSNDGSCPRSSLKWHYLTSSCPEGKLDECGSLSSCGSCTGRLGCGWCSADNKCKTGGSSGSNDGSCRSSLKWHYVPSECLGDSTANTQETSQSTWASWVIILLIMCCCCFMKS